MNTMSLRSAVPFAAAVVAIALLGAGCGKTATTTDAAATTNTVQTANTNTVTNASATTNTTTNTNTVANTNAAAQTNSTTETADTTATTPTVKEFSITAKRFEFEPSTITVAEGDQVKLNITSTDTTHGFSLAAFGVGETIAAGKTVTVEFTADKKGEFEFLCSVVCGSGHGGMTGTLVVE